MNGRSFFCKFAKRHAVTEIDSFIRASGDPETTTFFGQRLQRATA